MGKEWRRIFLSLAMMLGDRAPAEQNDQDFALTKLLSYPSVRSRSSAVFSRPRVDAQIVFFDSAETMVWHYLGDVDLASRLVRRLHTLAAQGPHPLSGSSAIEQPGFLQPVFLGSNKAIYEAGLRSAHDLPVIPSP